MVLEIEMKLPGQFGHGIGAPMGRQI